MAQLDKASSYKQLAEAMRDLDVRIKSVGDELSALKKAKELIQDGILPAKMNEEGLETVNLKGIGRLSVRGELRVSAAAGAKEQLMKWLEENGYGAMVQDTVNSSTLKAFIAECIREGRDYPDELINMHSFDRVTLTKK